MHSRLQQKTKLGSERVRQASRVRLGTVRRTARRSNNYNNDRDHDKVKSGALALTVARWWWWRIVESGALVAGGSGRLAVAHDAAVRCSLLALSQITGGSGLDQIPSTLKSS